MQGFFLMLWYWFIPYCCGAWFAFHALLYIFKSDKSTTPTTNRKKIWKFAGHCDNSKDSAITPTRKNARAVANRLMNKNFSVFIVIGFKVNNAPFRGLGWVYFTLI